MSTAHPVADFLTHLAVERQASAHTLDAYRRDLAALSQWAGDRDLQFDQLVAFGRAHFMQGTANPGSRQHPHKEARQRRFALWIFALGIV